MVYGRTVPSGTSIQLIGRPSKDLAISVRLDGQATHLWFAKELLGFVDHAVGTTVEIAGRELIRDERGEWPMTGG